MDPAGPIASLLTPQYGILGIVVVLLVYAVIRLYNDKQAMAKESREDSKEAIHAINGATTAVMGLTASVERQGDLQDALARSQEETARSIRAMEQTMLSIAMGLGRGNAA